MGKRDRKLRSGLEPADAEAETGERAVRALDYHLDLLEWMRTEEAHRLYRGVINISQRPAELGQDVDALAAYRLRDEIVNVGSCPTYFVTGEMGRVSKMAADSLPVGGALLPQDLPSRTGLAYLSSSVRFPDYGPAGARTQWLSDIDNAASVAIRAVSWKYEDRIAWHREDGTITYAPGVHYTLWCSGPDIYEAYHKIFEEARKRGELAGFNENELNHDAWRDVRFCPFEFSAWTFGHGYIITDLITPELTGGRVHAAVDWQRRFLLALWSLMGQEVAVVRPVHLKRPEERRRLRIKQKFPEFGDLKIVRLRRQYNPILELADDEEGLSVGPTREWTHRWWVRDHWAWRACGPRRSERRRVWIAPYIKGPEDKPLIEKDIIYSLER